MPENMPKSRQELMITVFFETPFWVCVLQRKSRVLEVCKITFGSEPKDYEVYEYLLCNWHLLAFSKGVAVEEKEVGKINPKRLQREIKRSLAGSGVGTKAQQALGQQREEHKLERKTKNKQQVLQEKQEKFTLRQTKKKQKHKGR